MRVCVFGRNAEEILPEVKKFGLEVVKTKPEVVISYGGDGTLLGAERKFPGIPKLPVRENRLSKKCASHKNEVVFDLLIRNKLQPTQFNKIEAKLRDKRLVGLNDIIVHHTRITSGVRYRIWIDGKPYSHEIVGDGLVMASAFGATGYYRSITHSLFRTGLGLAFNNSTEPVDHLVLRDDSVVRVRITRGPALLAADNDLETLEVAEGDEILIQKSAQQAVILAFDALRCSACRKIPDG
ncbi:MAG: hypothetical protein V2A74_00105 [bacterium]